jgi:hypothetical protein
MLASGHGWATTVVSEANEGLHLETRNPDSGSGIRERSGMGRERRRWIESVGLDPFPGLIPAIRDV